LKRKELEKLPVEVRFIPLTQEEMEKRQKKLELLLFKGAKNAVAKKSQ
jgi:hypothetical protein